MALCSSSANDENQQQQQEPAATTMMKDDNKQKKKDRAMARWSILRNALLNNNQQQESSTSTTTSIHSIHRFPGYQLLKPQQIQIQNNQSPRREMLEELSSLKVFDFNDDNNNNNRNNNNNNNNDDDVIALLIEKLEIAIVSLCAVYPKGCCLQVRNVSIASSSGCGDHEKWIQTIKQNCHIVGINVLVVENNTNKDPKKKKNDDYDDDALLLVQSLNNNNKQYQCCEYVLDDKCSLFIREPIQKSRKLSLEDLITHRTNRGVDNTGNICVWDSERTLAYLLYHHHTDILLFDDDNKIEEKIMMSPQQQPQSRLRILELGCGMAGLAAIALGLRLQQQQQQSSGRKIQITLTDGHTDGVKNNIINQYLTRKFSSSTWSTKDTTTTTTTTTITDHHNNHPYMELDIATKVLLWTTDLLHLPTKEEEECYSSSSSSSNNEKAVAAAAAGIHQLYDIVLISDCIHFQNFHPALAITTLRNVHVGGKAIFCQPKRGNSLENFCNLLLLLPVKQVVQVQPSQSSSQKEEDTYNHNKDDDDDDDGSNNNKLVHIEFRKHPIIEEQHQKAIAEYNNNIATAESSSNNVYDENLHYPKILIVTKLRELTQEDCTEFVRLHQEIHRKQQK